MRAQRLIVPVIAGVAVFGTVSAFAASLALTSETLGSNEVAVDACSAATVNVSYGTAFAVVAAAGRYEVDAVTVTSPAACVGKVIKVNLLGALGASLVEVSAPITVTPQTIVVPAGTPAQAVVGLAVVIAG